MMLRAMHGLCAVLLLCLSMAAGAHRFHFGMTDISYNPRTGSTEIVHTYTAHDVEPLLMNLYQRQFDLSDPQDQQVLRKYVEGRFWLAGAGGERLPVKWVGMTIDAQSVVIYQELERTPLARIAAIHQGVLADFIPEQINTVNLSEDGAVRSLTFTRQAPEQPAH